MATWFKQAAQLAAEPSGPAGHLYDPPQTAIPVGILVSCSAGKSRVKRSRLASNAAAHCTAPKEKVNKVEPAALNEVWQQLAETEPTPPPRRRGRVRGRIWPGVVFGVVSCLMTASVVGSAWMVLQAKLARGQPAPARRPEQSAHLVSTVIACEPIHQAALVRPAENHAAREGEALALPSGPRAPDTHDSEWLPKGFSEKEPLQPLAKASAAKAPECEAEGKCTAGDGRYGTRMNFVDDPAEAAKQALKEKKLLFVLNISGNFEDDKFT